MTREDPVQTATSIRARLENHLKGKPFHFNADTAALEGILFALAKRKEQYGEEYCPCRRVTGDKDEDAKIICPCIHHLKELEVDGHCHCRLFTRD